MKAKTRQQWRDELISALRKQEPALKDASFDAGTPQGDLIERCQELCLEPIADAIRALNPNPHTGTL